VRRSGRKRIITPLLLPLEFGDGRQVIAIEPVVTGLSHYVVAVDWAWHLNNRDGLRAYLSYIYGELEAYFGACECEECREGEDRQWIESPHDGWPRPCFQIGTRWWQMEGRDANVDLMR
jgi:hypothetical protein